MTKNIKQDINFLEYPLWQPEIKSKEAKVWRDRDGFIYRAGYKVPSKTDFVFLLFLLMHSQQNGWKTDMVLTQKEILKGCNLEGGKWWRDRLKDSLERWVNVTLKFEGTFYDGREYQVMNFGIIDDWDIEKKTRHLRIRFNPRWLLRIRESNFFKYIDFEQIKPLQGPIAIRLYELLIKTFKGRLVWKIDARKLAEKIPIKDKYPAHIIKKVEAAVNRINTSTRLKIDLEVERPRRGKAIFTFRKRPRCKKNLEHPETDEMMALVRKEFRGYRTIRAAVSRWLTKKGPDYVRRNILYANEKSTRQYRVYLLGALKEDWASEWWEDRVNREKDLAVLKRIRNAQVVIDGKRYESDENGFIFIQRNKVLCPGEVVRLVLKGRAEVVGQ